MSIIKQIFTICPVGQGLFYTGYLNADSVKEPFRMVFDCGSLNKQECRNAVEGVRADFFGDYQTLDLLVISHFDEDHVSHIQQLLTGGIKVRRLIMPFLSFETRLVLAMEIISKAGDERSGELNAIVRLVIDPLGALSDNLDGDSEIFFITKGPEGPPVDNPVVDNPEERARGDNGIRMELGFNQDAKQPLHPGNRLNPPNGAKAYGVDDHHKAHLLQPGVSENLMEFIFYRRYMGIDEDEYFKKIADAFISRCNIQRDLPDDQFLKELVSAVAAQKNGSLIRELFGTLSKGLQLGVVGRSLNNLNTSALCMLHRNLPGIYRSSSSPDKRRHYLDITQISWSGKGPEWNKPFELAWDMYPYLIWHDKMKPDNLLTSDSYLKRNEEVLPFIDRYGQFINDFQHFQVPHHGSKNNICPNLLARLARGVRLWINYGTTHRFENRFMHPDAETIHSIASTGHLAHYFPVNEFYGYQITCTIY